MLEERRARLERWLHWRFRPAQRSDNMYRGVYRDFAEARVAMGPQTGFDSNEGAALYRARLDRVFPEDYPLLYWLQPIAKGVKRVFDFGGHVGLHYYAFKTRLPLRADIEWVVGDVPAVQRAGEELAKSRGVAALKFCSGFEQVDGCEVLISSGALQFVEEGALQRALPSSVKHVLLNKLPVTERQSFVTVQDAWSFKAPYTVFNRGALVSSLETLGFELRDSWENPGHHLLMWRDPAHSVEAFSGLYFSRP